MMRILSIILATLVSVASAFGQEAKPRLRFDEVAVFAALQTPEEVVRVDLVPYCFDELDAQAEALITDSARSRDPLVPRPTVIFEYIRKNPCRTEVLNEPRPTPRPSSTSRDRPEAALPAVRERPAEGQSSTSESERETPLAPATESSPTPTSYVVDGQVCSLGPADQSLRRDLRIPRYLTRFYVFLQGPGPLESSESERLAAGMEREDFINCFEAFRATARSRNMLLIITATNERHEVWDQPKIVYRGESLRVRNYKVPDEARIFPGALVPLN